MPSVEEVLSEAERTLKASGEIEHPHRGAERVHAEDILAFVLDVDHLDPEEEVGHRDAARFRRLVARRAAGEPTAYITGTTEFFGLRLEVRPGAFIPRQSTEWMVVQAIRRLRGRLHPTHVDLATGIGPVALAVASSVPPAMVYGVDVSRRPVELARRNAARVGLTNVRFLQGDLFAPLPPSLRGRVDVISCHPPYVGKRELRELPKEILSFEPEESLTDYTPQGMGLLGRIVLEAPQWLRPGGWVLIEVSPDRSRAVAAALRRAGYRDVRSTLGTIPVSRVVVGRR